MSGENFRTQIYIWDFDRPDSLFHARSVIASLFDAAQARTAIRAKHRFAVLLLDEDSPPDLNFSPFSNIETLEAALRTTLAELDVKTGMKVLVQGLPDVVRMIETVIASCTSPFPIKITYQPQMDGTTLGHTRINLEFRNFMADAPPPEAWFAWARSIIQGAPAHYSMTRR
jgi:hypothetical protein